MIGFLVTGHGDFARGVSSSLEMIAGGQEDYEVVVFEDNMALEDFQGEIEKALKKLTADKQEAVIFTDLLGGTPFRVSMLVASQYEGVEVITGTNLPMLLEGISLRFATGEVKAFVAGLLAVGKEGIQNPQLELTEDADSGTAENAGTTETTNLAEDDSMEEGI